MCYADDTLVVAWESDWEQTIRLTQAGVTHVIKRIRALGLKVALEKTEAIWFGKPGSRGPPRIQIIIEGVTVQVEKQLKYLGLGQRLEL